MKNLSLNHLILYTLAIFALTLIIIFCLDQGKTEKSGTLCATYTAFGIIKVEMKQGNVGECNEKHA